MRCCLLFIPLYNINPIFIVDTENTGTDDSTPMRLSWQSSEKSKEVRALDNSLIQFWGHKENFGVIRTKYPIPKQSQGYYFQIVLLHTPEKRFSIDIGLTSKSLTTKGFGFGKIVTVSRDGSGFRNIPYSFGYSSSGIIYGTNAPEKFSQRQVYSGGDVIGCYVDNINAMCVFTKNGILLNKLMHLTNMEEPLFPTIAFSSNGTIIDSYFGEKVFEFDMQGRKEL